MKTNETCKAELCVDAPQLTNEERKLMERIQQRAGERKVQRSKLASRLQSTLFMHW